jgi:hypothetical protein
MTEGLVGIRNHFSGKGKPDRFPAEFHFGDYGVSQELRLSNLGFLLTFMKGGRLFTVNAICAIVRIRER